VACASATLCLAVGYDGTSNGAVAVALNPANGAALGNYETMDTDQLLAVACASATLCLGVGYTVSDALGFGMAPLDPATGQLASGEKVQGVSETDQLNGVACQSTTRCLAVGRNNNGTGATLPVYPATGKVVKGHSPQSIAGSGSFQGVACPSATACVAVGYDIGFETALLDPASGELASGQGLQDYSGDGELYGMACAPGTTLCVAVGANGVGDTVTWGLALRTAVFTKEPPSSAKEGSSIMVKVSVEDSSGNVVTGDGTDSVTLARARHERRVQYHRRLGRAVPCVFNVARQAYSGASETNFGRRRSTALEDPCVHFQRKWTKILPKFFESFSTRWYSGFTSSCSKKRSTRFFNCPEPLPGMISISLAFTRIASSMIPRRAASMSELRL
jgi:hypothetical protein